MKAMAKFRAELGISAREMAERVGVSQSYYDKIEYGKKAPGRGFILKFKKAFPSFDISLFFEDELHEKQEKTA